MKRNLALMLGAGAGAGLMYLFDPRDGRRRRALMRDKGVRAMHRTRDAFDTTSHDLANRWQGVQANMRARLQDEGPISDRRLVERIRAQLGRDVSHPRAIGVEADNGHVILSGVILAHEADHLVHRVSAVRGVEQVEDRLERHAEAGSISALQGEPAESLPRHWSPTARLLAGTAGAVGTLYGLARRDAVGGTVGLAGLALLMRAATNKDWAQLIGVGSGADIDIRKGIHIQAPVERVYELWSDYENLPRFMSHVQSVERLDEHRWRWTVTGPTGTPIEWEARETERIPNQRLAWRSEPGGPVEHEGSVHFVANADGTTTAHVHLSYAPFGGMVGHSLIRMLGTDPKRRMDDDLLRMKTFIETGKPPHDAPAESGQLAGT